MLSVYGRKPVLEALADNTLQCQTLHLADSNKESGIVADILSLAATRGVSVKRHSRVELARISKNGKQDQGVALDVLCPGFMQLQDFLDTLSSRNSKQKLRFLALDGISNPQNLGMIIRSAAAGNIDGIIWSRKGNAALGPLVIKASAGTLYRAPILLCQTLPEALRACAERGMEIFTLQADAAQTLFEQTVSGHCIYVLGNETSGVSQESTRLASKALSIPMNNGVESLNVAITASLIAYADVIGSRT